MIDITRFLDDKLRVKSWPSKHDMKVEVLRHVACRFESGRFYTEKEVNKIIDEWHTFNDYFLIRRELINNRLLSRINDGSKYWREET